MMGYMSRTRMYECMHARTHAWTHTHTHTGRRSGGQEGADGARETGKGHASYTADIHNTGGCVCVCVYVCVCVCDSEIFTGCQARREVARGRSCLFGTLSGAGLNNCIRIGCVHECSVWECVCMHACMYHPKTIHRSPPNFPAAHAKKAPAKCLTSPLGRWRRTRARRRRCGSSMSPTERYPDRHCVLVALDGH